MPFPLLLALRYLRSTRKDAFVTFLSAVAAGGLALGVAALILALSALSGFQNALRSEILARTPQIEIDLPRGTSAGDAAAATHVLEGRPDVMGVAEELHGRGWLVAGSRVQAVELTGFSERPPASFPGIREGREGLRVSDALEGLYISDALAMRWGLHPGEPVQIVSPRALLTPLGPQPRTRELPLAGMFSSGRTERDERAAAPMAIVESLLGDADRRLVVATAGLDAALRVAPTLRPLLPAGAVVRTWQDLNRPLFFALRLEKSVMFVAVFLIVIVAALALVADLALVIANKRPEIGMLGAMGATPTALRNAFLWLGGLIAGIGTLLGAAVGVGGAWVLDRYRVISLPQRVYFLDYVPFLTRSADLAVVLGATLLLALLCAAYAARRAAALRPVEALRR